MQRFANDPFGCKLMKSNQHKRGGGGKKEEKKPEGGGGGGGGGGGAAGGYAAMPNFAVSNYMFAGPVAYAPYPVACAPYPVACAPYPGFYQFVNGCPQMPFAPAMAVALPAPAPAPAAPAKAEKGPPPHECVACNAKNKCKKCLQKEEEEKNLVVKRSFCSPRGSFRPSIFSNRVIRSD